MNAPDGSHPPGPAPGPGPEAGPPAAPEPPPAPARRPAAALVARALWAGAIAGAGAGALDTLAGWRRLGQFLPTVGAKLGCALHVASLYGAVAALAVAVAIAGGLALLRGTRLGEVLAGGLERQRARRARDPREALAGLSLAIAGVPAIAAALAVAYQIGVETIARRHHKGLIVAVVIAATVLACAGAVLVAFVAGRLVEALLRLAARGRVARALAHPAAPALAILALAAAAAAAGAIVARRTLAQLPLRPYLAAAGITILLAPAWLAAGPALARLARLRPNARHLAHGALVGLLLAVALATGASPAVRKGASAFTGLGGPLATAIRRAADLDRDGYSALLGGGDCDDWDRAVNPGALELPDDGVDQNCMGGDLRLTRRPEDVRFTAVPPSVPADASVLLVTIDTLRADHVGAYGYARPTTPALDALAAEGALFVNAWAHAPSTRYCMPAIFTGRYPSQVLWDNSVWWPALALENRTLSEVLKDRGFTTGAIFNYHYFDRVRRFDQGFDEYDNSSARLHTGRDPASTRGSSSREQADLTIRYLERHAGERFFLWVHFYDPHYEFERHPGTTSFGDSKIDLYDHEIRYTDDHLARVLARLRELGLYDRTIVVVAGDHGEGFGEHGIDFHGYHLYAPQTKVPLVIRVPGLAPRRITTPAGHVDLMPTLANLAGAPPEPAMQGRSLLGELSGEAPADGDRDVYQEVVYEGPTERRAAVTRRWHLIFNRVPDNTWELYDLAADPGETRDLWGGPDVEDLRGRLLAWIDASQYPPDAAEKVAAALLRERPAPAIAARADLDGGAVRLLGLDVSATEVRAGDRLTLTWYFEPRRRVGGDWRMFVHFEGPGRFLGDHDLVGGALPPSRWAPGQLIADRHEVTVPAGTRPGEYTIYAGLFRGGKRMTVTNAGPHDGGGNRIRAATVRVVR